MIKVTKGKEEDTFPKLMVAKYNSNNDEGMIVLFSSHGVGTVISVPASSDKKIGDHKDSWVYTCFIEYNTPITIQNT